MKQLAILLLVVFVSSALASEVQLWSGCMGVICAKLMNTPPCGLRMVVTMSDVVVVDEPMDIAMSTEVCQQYGPINYCILLQNTTVGKDGQVHPCVWLKQSVGGSTSLQNLGCVTAANSLAQCLTQGCPNGCSDHGTCNTNTNKCNCKTGYYGDDCSLVAPIFQQCQQFDPYGSFCLSVKIEDCGVDITVYPEALPSLVLYDKTITAPAFNTYFTTSTCVDASLPSGLSGQLCLMFNNFVLNETYARACPAMNMTVLGIPQSFQYGCFEDDNLVPACFGTCPKDCSGNGACVNGACVCNEQYKGPTCEIPNCDKVFNCYGNGECIAYNTCNCSDGYAGTMCYEALCIDKNNCSSHGVCRKPNLCVCSPGFTGDTCSEIACAQTCLNGGQCVAGTCKCAAGYTGDACSERVNPSVTPSAVYVVIGVFVGLGVAGAGGVAAFVIWKRKRQQRVGAFSSFDDGLIQVPESPEDSS